MASKRVKTQTTNTSQLTTQYDFNDERNDLLEWSRNIDYELKRQGAKLKSKQNKAFSLPKLNSLFQNRDVKIEKAYFQPDDTMSHRSFNPKFQVVYKEVEYLADKNTSSMAPPLVIKHKKNKFINSVAIYGNSKDEDDLMKKPKLSEVKSLYKVGVGAVDINSNSRKINKMQNKLSKERENFTDYLQKQREIINKEEKRLSNMKYSSIRQVAKTQVKLAKLTKTDMDIVTKKFVPTNGYRTNKAKKE